MRSNALVNLANDKSLRPGQHVAEHGFRKADCFAERPAQSITLPDQFLQFVAVV